MLGNVDLKFYLSIFLRRLPYFVVIAVFLSALGIAVASILPPIYRASATILVEAPQIPGDLAKSTVPGNPIEQIQIIGQRLTTRANLLSLADRFRLYADQPGISANAVVADMRARIELLPQAPARGGPGATMIEIAFSSKSPAEAAEVANELVTLILQENVSLRTGRAEDTLGFFRGEVDRLAGELDRVAQRIMAFKAENERALPDSLGFRRNQQATLQERLLQYEREATALQDQRERMVELYESTGTVLTGAPRTPEERDLEEMRRQLAQARVIFSAGNPKIRLLEVRVAGLEAIVAEQREAAGGAAGALSEYEVQLAELDGRLAFIDEEKGRIQAELAELQTSIEATPANELVLAEMQRDYDNLQRQYNAATERLATASVGERLEVMSKGQRFSLVEPAAPPASPDEPNRMLIAGAGVAGGIGGGLAFVLLLELLNRSIRRPSELSAGLGIQPFVTIPYMRTQHELAVKRTAMLAVLAAIVVGIPLALFAIHTYYLPLDLLMRRALGAVGLGGV
jgi:polysaccharide chain length determinant protein (PEP-CTERM system associated)